MAMCAHNPKHAQGKCPSKEVAREFARKPSGGYKKRKRKGQGVPRPDKNGYY